MDYRLIHEVSKVLLQDPVLIQNYEKLCHRLSLGRFHYQQHLQLKFKLGGITSYELFSNILQEWVSRKGRSGTLQKLIEILNELDFIRTADKLRKFGGSRMVESSQLKEIVQVLIEDEPLIKEWSQFISSLGLDNYVDLKMRHHFWTITDYELFYETLTRWKSAKGDAATIDKLAETLERLDFKSTADKLQTTFDIISTTNPTISFEIQVSIRNFVGRSKEIEELNKWFKRSSGFEIVKVVGLGGIGKSELARKFARTVKNETNEIWLNGDNKESIRNSIVQLAKVLGVPNTNHNQSRDNVEILFEIMTAIKQKNKLTTLLIIDNVDAENEDVLLILQTIVKLRIFAVVTSTSVSALNHVGQVIHLDVLTDEEAILFVQNSIADEIDSDILRLCKLLGNFPLALQQAVAFIKSQKRTGLTGQSYKINDFFNDYESNKAKVFDFQLNKIEHAYTETTLTTWNMTIDQIRSWGETGQLAIQLLNILAFLEPENIQIDFLRRLYKESGEKGYKIDDAICLLINHSLIEVEDHKISIHRLVQQIIRLHLSASNLEVELLRKLMKSIQGIVPTFEELEIGHILSIWRYGFKYDDLIQDFVHLPYQISKRLQELSLFKEMLDFARESEQLYEKVLGPMHLETLQMTSQIARALDLRGRFSEALQLYENVLKEQKSNLGDEAPQTIWIMQRIGELLMSQGKFDEAKVVLQTILELKTKMFGPSDPSTKDTQEKLKDLHGRSENVIKPSPASPSTKLSEDLTNLAINEIEIADIVGVLLEAGEFIQNWTRFYKGVELEEIKMLQLEILYKKKRLEPFDLIARVINLWVESGTPPKQSTPYSFKSKVQEPTQTPSTLANLIQVLETNDFLASAGGLRNRFESRRPAGNQDRCDQVTIKANKLLSSYKNLVPDRALWYRLGDQMNSNSSPTELSSMEGWFSQQCATGIIEVVLITGPQMISNSKLAVEFASNMFKSRHVSCIGIDGKELQSEFIEFMKGCGGNNKSDSIMVDLCKMFRGRKWIMIFKDVDTPKDIEYLQSNILQPLRQVPPDQGPFIIVTSSNLSIESESFRFIHFRHISPQQQINLFKRL